jgi:hypothetical protein
LYACLSHPSSAYLIIMMFNAGGAWSNSKKYIEIEKYGGGKGTDTHKAFVVADAVRDPFKRLSSLAPLDRFPAQHNHDSEMLDFSSF